MTVVSTRELRANQTKFLSMVSRGEQVILLSRLGHYRLMPFQFYAEGVTALMRDVTAETCQDMKDWKEHLETGKSDKFHNWEELMDEL